jgi:predicted membrane protein
MRAGYELGAGELIVDLRDVDLPAGTTPLKIDMGIGHAVVRVPEDACVSSDVQIGAGHAQVLDRVSDGLDVDLAQAATPPGDGPRLVLDGQLGIGALEVVRGDDPLPRRGMWDAADLSGPACP